MGRPRKHNSIWPARCYEKSGTVYYQWKGEPPFNPQTGDRYKTWTRLGPANEPATVLATLSTLLLTPSCNTVNQLVDHFVKVEGPNWPASTRASYTSRLNFIRAALGHMHPEALTVAGVKQYVQARERGTNDIAGSPSRANNEKRLLKQVLQLALEDSLISRNVAAECTYKAKEKKRKGDNGTARKVVTDDQLVTFLNVVPEWVQVWTLLACATGARKNDICSWTWDSITSAQDDDGNDLLVFTASKTDKQHVFTLTEQLQYVLARARKLANGKSLYVVCDDRGRQVPVNGVSNAFKNAARRDAFALGRWTPHDLRARAITNVVKQTGGDLNAGRLLAGHSNVQVTGRYVVEQAPVAPVQLPDQLLN